MLAGKRAGLRGLVEQVMQVDQDGTCVTGHPGATDFLLTDGVEEVVARVKMVESIRGRHAEDEVCLSDGQDWSSPVEASHIFQNW